jgi:hypothetical protein
MATKSIAIRLAIFSLVFAALLALHECVYVYHASTLHEILLHFSLHDRLLLYEVPCGW